MKFTIFFIIVFYCCASIKCQSFSGVTGIPDTSYSTISAYNKDVKKYPFIEIVKEFDIEGINEIRDVTYCSIDNKDLKLDIFIPEKDKSRIAIIIIHGGGWRSGHRSQHYPLAQKLASFGHTCFTPEYRLSTEALFPAAVYDVKASIRWVRKNAGLYGIDPEKIVIAGFSAGGELAAFMGTTGNMPLFEGSICDIRYDSHVNAVIDMDGTLSFVHPESGEGDDSRKTSSATYWFGYSKNEMFNLWKAASPLSYVGPKTPPTLFINSSKATMHAGRDDYIKEISRHNIYSNVQVFNDAPHSFCLYYPWFDDVVVIIKEFLNKVFNN